MDPSRFFTVSRRPRLRRLLLVGLGMAALAGAGPAGEPVPEIVRAAIPSRKIADFFPAGAPLRLMAPAEFDALVERAEGQARRAASDRPRLVRARHWARFGDGLLTGRSELVVSTPGASPPSGPAAVSIEPWSPAVLKGPGPGAAAGSRTTGEAAVWLDPPEAATAEAVVVLEWELRARPDSRGRLFALALPGDETSSLTLDAPRGFAPSGPAGRREGPAPGPEADRALWRFHGRPSTGDLRLVELGAERDESNRPRVWVGGPTRIDLGAAGGEAARTANFTTDWTVEIAPGEADGFAVELGAGVELLDVVGPAVRDFQLDPPSERGTTRAVVALAPNSDRTSKVQFRAHARAPLEGPWTAPSIRPLPPAVWTGGATTITLDAGRVVRGCRERDGRRIPSPPPEAGAPPRFVFEATAPGPVAELTFAAAPPPPPYVVRGRLLARESSTRLECDFEGLGAGGGSTSDYEIELPPNWTIDRVRVGGGDDAVTWRQTVGGDGRTLLRVLAPLADASAEGVALSLGAGSTVAPGRGPLALPRVRLTTAPAADETWAALVDGATTLTPISTRGLAWIDPAPVKGLLPPGSPDLKPALGWRWTAESASAMVERGGAPRERQGWIHLKARVAERGRRLDLIGRITVTGGGETPEALPIWLDLPPGAAERWTFRDPATGRALAAAPAAAGARARRGFPPRAGVVLEVAAERPVAGRTTIDFRAEAPWTGRGPVPLPCLPAAFSPRCIVAVETPHRMRSNVTVEGLSRVAPSLADRLAPPPEPPTPESAGPDDSAASPYRTSHALAYGAPGGKLELATEALTPAAIPGVIRDARLTTLVYPKGRRLNRLRLAVEAEPSASIPLRLPSEAVLARVRVDGVETAPALDGGRLSIPPPRAPAAASRLVELDYHVEAGADRDPRRPRPVAPDFGLACLSFGWDLVLPADWTLDGASPDLVVNSTASPSAWPFGPLGFPNPRWPGAGAPPRLGAQALDALDAQTVEAASGESTFSELFIRWDAGADPVVIDRLALSAEGCEPDSRCKAAPRDASGAEPSLALRTLERNGLGLTRVDDAIVVTSRREAAAEDVATTWRDAVVEALFWGADRTDRFQSTARWRDEAASAGPVVAGGAAGGRRLPGWSTWRLSSAGWPGPGSEVRTSDRAGRVVPGWLLAALVVVVGLGGARTPRRGLVGPLLLMAAATAVYDRAWVADPLTAGAFLGSLGLLLVQLGRLLRTTIRETVAGRWSRRRRGGGAAPRVGARVAALVGASAVCLAIPPAWAALDAGKPIVAWLPYDGGYDPEAAPTRVVVLEDDYQRLARIARPPGADGTPDLAILGAEHHVQRSKGREAEVVSDYTLRLGPGAATFEFPVSGARDIQAAVDGRPVPVVITADGALGAATLDGGRTVKLQIRRTAVAAVDGGLEVLDLKINPTPAARLTLAQPAEFLPIQHLNARGRETPRGDRTIEANLGPVDHVEILWKSEAPALDQPGASVESIILWDLDPAGERIRARLTYRPRRRTSRIEIGLDPGLIPRAVSVPGLVDASWEGTPQAPKWVATVDPPLANGAVVELDLWRPSPSGGAADASGAVARRFPRLEPLGVDREVGLLAARRPSYWTGRLEPIPGAEPISDEGFVRAWKNLPDDPLTFAGTVRFNARDSVEFRTGPTPTRMKLRPSARLQIEAGRVDCRIEAELSDVSGLLDHLDLQLPEPLIVLGVESEGMTDWSRPKGGPLQVRFDRVEPTSRRSVKIRGWVPVAELDARARPRRFQTPLPWIAPSAPGVSTAPGVLTVVSRAAVDLPTASGGAVLLSSGTAEVGGPGARQIVYRIDDPARTGALQWEPAPPRVNVQVLSQATIHPDSAEWFAVLRCDVAGGPLDAIHLKVPSAWAARARLQLGGQDHQLTTESRGASTFWTITPERPIWGSERLVLRSRLPVASEQEVDFPEVAPLGEGVVDAWLGLVSATASPPTPTWLPGLRPVVYASRFPADEFGDASGLATRAYHVERENWSLKVQAPRHADAARAASDSARLKSAEIACVAASDGSLLGRASYQTEPRTGSFLKLELPPRGRPAWATVAGAAAAPLLGEGGNWMIPLNEQASQCVTVVWTEPPAGGARLLELPRAGVGATPALVSVHLPAGLSLKPAAGGLELVGSELVDQERSDRIAQRITEFLAEIDHGSGRDRDRLASMLISHELALRTVEHALRAVARRGVDRARREQATRGLDVVKASRAAVLESVRSVGLEEQVEAARIYLGLSGGGAEAPARGVPEPTGVDRIRKLGKPTYLIGPAPGLQEPPISIAVVAEGPSWYARSTADRARSTLLLVLLLGLGVVGLTAARLASAQALMAAASLALAGLAGGPPGLALAGAAVAAGWTSAVPRPPRETPETSPGAAGSTVVRSPR